MATRKHDLESGGHDRLYTTAALAGLAAGVVFGIVIQFALGRMTTIGALFTLGEENLAVGWTAHAVNSVVFALGYALLTRWERVRPHADAAPTGTVTGAAYGFALWFVNIGFVWPVWLGAVTPPPSPPVPNLAALGPLAGHLLWGALLGALFPLVRTRL